jgi:hypothetical protein
VDAVMADLLALAKELAEPHVHVESYHTWKNRNRKNHEHRTVHDPLVTQLHTAATDPARLLDDVGGGRSNKPASRPPLAIEAFSRWLAIRDRVAGWLRVLHLEPRDSPEAGIRSLAIYSMNLDQGTAQSLVRDMKMWKTWCGVMTGWGSKVLCPAVGCPVCESFRSIRISCDTGEGFCVECQHAWVTMEDLISLGKGSLKTAA